MPVEAGPRFDFFAVVPQKHYPSEIGTVSGRSGFGSTSPLLADAGAQPLATPHDGRDGIHPLLGGLAETHLLDRLAHIVRRQSLEHPRDRALARRAPGSKGEDVHLELVGALAAAQAVK